EKRHPELKLPSVWFPQGIMGISTSGILNIDPADFGPYKNQLLVGDQGQSKIMRVDLEKVDGKYQGACFPFREGFSSGVLRLLWGKGATLYVGMTGRGWPSMGGKKYGLQRLTWTGKVPFEMKTIHATSYGFDVTFTKPVNKQDAEKINSYQITNFTYKYHSGYGSPIIDKKACSVTKAEVAENGTTVKLYVDGLRKGYIHEVKIKGIHSAEGQPPLHDFAYYTMNNFADGYTGNVAENNHETEMTTGENESQSCAADASKTITAQPADWDGKPDKVITLNTKPGLKFDKSEFIVKAGSHVKLIFNNKDDMLHNLVVGAPGD